MELPEIREPGLAMVSVSFTPAPPEVLLLTMPSSAITASDANGLDGSCAWAEPGNAVSATITARAPMTANPITSDIGQMCFLVVFFI